MTKDEFDTWFRYHSSYFTGIASWLGKLPRNPPTGQLGQGDVLKAWYRTLSRVSAEDAHAATEKLNQEDEQPKSFDRHPAVISRIARRLRAQRSQVRPHYVDGERTHRCKLCQDEGRLFVWHRESVKLAMGQGGENAPEFGEPGTLYSAAVLCTCESAEQYAGQCERYNPKQHCLLEPGVNGRKTIGNVGDPEEHKRLREWIADTVEERNRQYEWNPDG